MNKKILLKTIEELQKATPNISYILGMLETLAEMEGAQIPIIINNPPHVEPKQTNERANEPELPGYLKTGPVGNISYS